MSKSRLIVRHYGFRRLGLTSSYQSQKRPFSSDIPTFDYEERIWANHRTRLEPTNFAAMRLRFALEELSSCSGKVLEIGSGGGSMAKALKHYRPDLGVYACDISLRAVRHGAIEPDWVEFSLGNAYDVPFSNSTFDAVVIFDVLEHLADPGRAIAEAARVLKPRGRLHVSVPCEGNLLTVQGFIRSIGWRGFERNVGHIQAFDLGDLFQLFEAGGLHVSRTVFSGHLISQLAHSAYVGLLELTGARPSTSVEGFVEARQLQGRGRITSCLKSTVAVLMYFESRLLWWLPAANSHVTAQLP